MENDNHFYSKELPIPILSSKIIDFKDVNKVNSIDFKQN